MPPLAWQRWEKAAIITLTKPFPHVIPIHLPTLTRCHPSLPHSDLGLWCRQPTGHSLFFLLECLSLPPHPIRSDSHFLFISRPSGLFLPGSAHVYFILSICIYPQHSPLWLVLTSLSSSLPGGPEPSLPPCLSQDLAQCLACSGARAGFLSFSSPDGVSGCTVGRTGEGLDSHGLTFWLGRQAAHK